MSKTTIESYSSCVTTRVDDADSGISTIESNLRYEKVSGRGAEFISNFCKDARILTLTEGMIIKNERSKACEEVCESGQGESDIISSTFCDTYCSDNQSNSSGSDSDMEVETGMLCQ
jgi:hypothetical protein